MNANLLAIVNRIVAEQGEGILADAKRLFPYFSDYAKNEQKEERVAFGRCIEMGAYQELKRTRTPDEWLRKKAALANQMNAKTGIDRLRCAEALDLLEAVIFKPARQTYPPQSSSPAVKKTHINKGVWGGIAVAAAAAAAIVVLAVSYYSNRPSVQPEYIPETETASPAPSASAPPSGETATAPSPGAGAPSSGETAPPPAAGYSQAQNGTWYEESYPYDPDFALKLNNGKIDSEYLRGTYTIKNNEITITPSHYIGWFFKVFGDYFLMSGIHAFEWYSREQMENLLINHPLNIIKKPSAKDINEILDVMYPTETNPIIGGNKFSLSYLNYTYLKPSALQQQAQTNTVQPKKEEKPMALPPAAGNDRMEAIPYKIEGGTTSSWLIFQPSIPHDVPQDIYTRLWNINLKTIKAGKYDFNAFNYNTAQFIAYDESALSDNFTFAGVCMNYADYFIFVLKHDGVLLELYNKGIITANTSPSHKWIEYRTENNRYIIDPTWCDWDYVGEPAGIYANNAAFAEACRTSFNRDKLIEASSMSWFFRNVKTVTGEFDKNAHGL